MRSCVVAAVDLNARAAEVILRGAMLARQQKSPLLVVHVVEHHTGFEAAHVPFLSPTRLREGLARDARMWLQALLQRLGLGPTEIMVVAGDAHEMLAQTAVDHHARLMITGSLKWGALAKLAHLADDPRLAWVGCEVLHLQPTGSRLKESLARWAENWLARGRSALCKRSPPRVRR